VELIERFQHTGVAYATVCDLFAHHGFASFREIVSVQRGACVPGGERATGKIQRRFIGRSSSNIDEFARAHFLLAAQMCRS